MCWAADEEAARRTALEWWPNAGIEGELPAELPLPRHFEQAAGSVTEEALAEKVVCGPRTDPILEKIGAFVDAGFDHVFLHQVGPRQEEFLEFAKGTLLPAIDRG